MKKTILSMMLVVNFLFGFSQTQQKQKFNKTIALDNYAVFELTNVRGSTIIENTNEPKLTINCVISVTDDSKLEAIWQKVDVNYQAANGIISVSSKIDPSIIKEDFKILFFIKMPKTLSINLKNSYGDVSIDNLNAKAVLDINYGKLTANKLLFGNTKPRSLVVLNYSSAEINQTDWLQLGISYSKLHIKTGVGLIIKSKYSHISVDNSVTIVADSKYDHTYELEVIKNFSVVGKYSGYNINKLAGLLDADLKYSDLKIKNITTSFSNVDVRIKFGTAKLNFEQNAAYSIEGETQYGTINMPACVHKKSQSDHTHSQFSALIGNQKMPKSKVSLVVKYGNINVK